MNLQSFFRPWRDNPRFVNDLCCIQKADAALNVYFQIRLKHQNLVKTALHNALVQSRRQAIIWNNADLWISRHLGTNLHQNQFEIPVIATSFYRYFNHLIFFLNLEGVWLKWLISIWISGVTLWIRHSTSSPVNHAMRKASPSQQYSKCRQNHNPGDKT